MNVQAFLDRIGFTGAHTPSAENLKRIIRCHLETVPFENLDYYRNPHKGSIQVEDIYGKVVNRRRGGVCFELNGLMYWALGQLGYERYPVAVRLYMRPDGAAPVTHQGNIAVVEGKRYYCDVGFGGPGPQDALCLDIEGPQQVYGDRFQVVWEGILCQIYREHDGNWNKLIAFADVPADPLDFEALLYYFTVNPESYFVVQRLVNLTRPDGSLALTDNTFTRRVNGQVTHTTLESEAEVLKLLRTEYGLNL